MIQSVEEYRRDPLHKKDLFDVGDMLIWARCHQWFIPKKYFLQKCLQRNDC